MRKRIQENSYMDIGDNFGMSSSEGRSMNGFSDDDDDGGGGGGKPATDSAAEKAQVRRAVVLLTLLYAIQGVPLGLAMGSWPYMLSARASFTALGVFSFAAYPYSLKLLWSPVVDAVFSRGFGRRKSWIVPIQCISGSLLLWMSGWMEAQLSDSSQLDVYWLTAWSLLLVFCAATQDIAVDGWAITMLPKEHLALASTVQSVGLQIGFFSSFTVLLALSSPQFSNAHVRPWLGVPADARSGVLSLSGYLFFWGVVYLLVSVYLVFHREESFRGQADELDIASTYRKMWRALSLGPVRRLALILLTAKVGLIAFDVVTGLKMLDKGFRKQDLALFAVLDFPVQLIASVVLGRVVAGQSALNPYFFGYTLRIVVGVALTVMLMGLPTVAQVDLTDADAAVGGVVAPDPSSAAGQPSVVLSWPVYLAGALGGVAYSFASTIMFVAMGAFFARICDTSISGTFMTLLNTINNFGGTFPKFFVLTLIDWLSDVPCVANEPNQAFGSSEPVIQRPPVDQCSTPERRIACTNGGGQCQTIRDGFVVVALLSVCYAVIYGYFVLNRQLHRLEKLPETAFHAGTYSSKSNRPVPL